MGKNTCFLNRVRPMAEDQGRAKIFDIHIFFLFCLVFYFGWKNSKTNMLLRHIENETILNLTQHRLLVPYLNISTLYIKYRAKQNAVISVCIVYSASRHWDWIQTFGCWVLIPSGFTIAAYLPTNLAMFYGTEYFRTQILGWWPKVSDDTEMNELWIPLSTHTHTHTFIYLCIQIHRYMNMYIFSHLFEKYIWISFYVYF